MRDPVMRNGLQRRTLLKACIPVLVGATGLPARAQATVLPPFGAQAKSESVLLAALDADGRRGFVARLCRYPGAGVAWAWAQVFDDHKVYSFTDPSWASTRDATVVGGQRVQYAARQGGARIEFERNGPRATPRNASVRLALALHQNPFAPDGPGAVPVTIEAAFRPVSSADGILDGRSEIKGMVSAKIVLGDRTLNLEAQGHFHEQQQESPRFVDPFVYFSGWGERTNFTLLMGVASSGGVVFEDGKPRKSVGLAIEAPAASRRFKVTFEDGAVLEGIADARYVFGQRIYGAWRTSRIVTGTFAGRRITGMLNDWLPDRLPYISASTGAATPSP